MVIGGQAVVRYGVPRLTEDVDLTLGIAPYESARLLRLLTDLGLSPLVRNPEHFISTTNVLPCVEADSPMRVDFSMTDSPYELQAIERGDDVILHDTPVRFVCVEDLLIHKMIATRPRDLDDALAVILRNPDFDRAYTRDWLARFAQALNQPLVENFDKLLREAET